MAAGDTRTEFTRPYRQVISMLMALALVAAGAVLFGDEIGTVFFANAYLNGFIGVVFLIGVFATFWQVVQLLRAIGWIEHVGAGTPGVEHTTPPRLVRSMTPVLREGKMQRRLTTSTTRTVLDSVATRLDEARDITRYIANLLIFLGLLGTFWGLSQTVPAVVDTIRSLAPEGGDATDASVFERLMSGLEEQLGGMGTAFASSLMGLAGSLIVGLLEIFAGHGQNRFFRQLEEWLSGFTRVGLVSEGEGSESAVFALLERLDEGLEVTNTFAARAEEARATAEARLGQAAEVISEIAAQIDRDRSTVADLVSELRTERQIGDSREAALLTVMKRIEHNQAQMLAAQQATLDATLMGSQQPQIHENGNADQLKAIDRRLLRLSEEISVGRHESVGTLRAELRALINLIDARTRENEV